MAHKLIDTFRDSFKDGMAYSNEPRRLNRGDIPYGIGNVTRTFNGICSEAGVQCAVSPAPGGIGLIYYFENLGDRLVQITYGLETRLIEPGEKVALKISDLIVPEIRTMNYGNPDA